MNPIVKKDILNVLQQASEIVSKGEYYRLRELSDHVIHNATIFQDRASIAIAVTIYSLSKIYRNSTDKFILPHLRHAIEFLEAGSMPKYEAEIKEIIGDIAEKDEKTKFYIQEVLERAQIKKASKMYEHGISMGQVAEALGVSLWDLSDYVGKTRIADQFEYVTNVKERRDFARKIFNLK